tara:strand:+ start:506 stop:1144 length:639 start_codon:yes stop_codon:yes gene_type:complete
MIIIVDYGIGNVFSVERSLEHCGAKNVKLSSDPDEIYNADRIILPGVGAFQDGIKGLKDRGLIEPLQNAVTQGKPLLGICLGMQMLVSSSKEFGHHSGLDFIPGKVVPIIESQKSKVSTLKIPYIGWAKLDIELKQEATKSVFNGIKKNSYVYLVHSFHVQTDNQNDMNGTYNYDAIKVTAAIQKDNVIGLQFHPEKSGEVGLNVIKNFLLL